MKNADQLLSKVLQAHGGLDRWRQAQTLTAHVSSGGFAFASKLKPTSLRGFEVEISTTEPRAVLWPYPDPGKRGIFEDNTVQIESLANGVVLTERANPRQVFSDFRHKFWWDDLDLLYFAGYAIWNYLSEPFLLTNPGFEIREIDPWPEGNETWRRLQVHFPPGVATHSPEQVFYFDEGGLLRRHDYTAEVFGSWAKAAHYCSEHKEFSGLVVPTRRRVFPRKKNGQIRRHPLLVWIEIKNVMLHERHAG